MSALDKAITITNDCSYRRTFHSDRGWAYQMKAYSQKLKENRIFQSMSRKGNCHDNSVMENFFGILKQEIYYGKVYYSYGVNLHFLKSDKTDDYLIIKIVPDGEEYRSSIRKILREVNLSVTNG